MSIEQERIWERLACLTAGFSAADLKATSSKAANALISEALAIEAEDAKKAGALRFMARALV